jgi:hypothetical protein
MYRKQHRMYGEHQASTQRGYIAISESRYSDSGFVREINLDPWEVCMASKKTNKKKIKKASSRSRHSPHKREVVVEEHTTVIPPKRDVTIRREPVTLSRALGEAAMVEPAAEPPLTSTTVRRKRA